MTSKSKFSSPFIYTTFQPNTFESSQSLYQKRILDVYRQQYPKLNDFSIADISDVLRSRKLKRFEAEQKAKEDAEKEAKEKEAADKADDAKPDDDQKDEAEKQENADDANKKDDDDAAKDDAAAKDEDAAKDDAADKDDAKKEDESNDQIDPKKEKVPDRVLSDNEKKVIYALELMEDEYYGNEHALYLYVCSKYNVSPKEESLGVDGDAVNDRASSTMTDRLMESEEGLLCSECLEWKPFTMFSRNELEMNGHFMACLKCEPDRDSVEHCMSSFHFLI